MRLICPNCGAQYEVPESVIPETGRDVQCSSCGHTWFQHHPAHGPAASPDAGDDDNANLWDMPEDRPASQPPARDGRTAAQTAPAASPARAAFDAAEDDDDDDEAEDEWEGFPDDPGLTGGPRPGTALRRDPEDPVSRLPEIEEDDYEEDPARDLPPPRRSLDTSVADLLREEAEREARARAAERGPGLESQPDLGLDSASSARAPLPEVDLLPRVIEGRQTAPRPDSGPVSGPGPAPEARSGSAQPQPPAPPPLTARRGSEDAASAAAVAESRRGLLPDIEEINSSLRSTSDRRPARAADHDHPGQPAQGAPEAAPGRRGFNRGFSVTLLVAMLLLALYVFAPALAEAVPALTPALQAYVSAIDSLRLTLDAQVQNLSRWLATIAGRSA
jgi:predicted Zn finger-like uncharacterized protein